VDQSYLCGGASGRNGGGIRAQWASESNILLMRESIRICRNFAHEMGIKRVVSPRGYLFLARTPDRCANLVKSVEIQNRCGLSTQMLTPQEAKKIVPELDESAIVAASYNRDDGVVFPWPFVWGYAEAATRLGVEIATFTKATDIESTPDRCARLSPIEKNRDQLHHQRGRRLESASGEVRRSLCAESTASSRDLRLRTAQNVPQTPRGGPVQRALYVPIHARGNRGGISNERVPEGLDMGSSTRFLGLYATGAPKNTPALGELKILRQWSGCYDLTPIRIQSSEKSMRFPVSIKHRASWATAS